jgi:hypothetical protein
MSHDKVLINSGFNVERKRTNYKLRARIRPAEVKRTTSKPRGWQITGQATNVNTKIELKPHALYISLGQRVNSQNHDPAALPQKTSHFLLHRRLAGVKDVAMIRNVPIHLPSVHC